MTAVAVILILVVYVPIIGLGAYLVATGRRVPLAWSAAVPDWPIRAGWPTRLLGLVYVVGGAGICVYIVRTGVTWESVIATYLVVGLVVAVLIRRARKASLGRGQMTAPR